MALTNVFSVELRPEKARAYEAGVLAIAEKARAKRDAFHWTVHQPIAGTIGRMHFVSQVPDWAGFAARDLTPVALVLRLFGETEGARLLETLSSCTLRADGVIGRERPDLSYPSDQAELARGRAPFSVVTRLRARAGHQDTCEELIRKIAEAIPKIDDPARILTYQTIVGDLRSYWTVRPLKQLPDLDRQALPGDLLTRAFGAAEGGLIFRSGMEAIEESTRSLVMLRTDLSHTG